MVDSCVGYLILLAWTLSAQVKLNGSEDDVCCLVHRVTGPVFEFVSFSGTADSVCGGADNVVVDCADSVCGAEDFVCVFSDLPFMFTSCVDNAILQTRALSAQVKLIGGADAVCGLLGNVTGPDFAFVLFSGTVNSVRGGGSVDSVRGGEGSFVVDCENSVYGAADFVCVSSKASLRS